LSIAPGRQGSAPALVSAVIFPEIKALPRVFSVKITFHADGACPGSPFNPTKIPRFRAETSLNLT
jgi:hypothetical protein